MISRFNLSWLLAGLCLLGAAALFFTAKGNVASAASCKGADALANQDRCAKAMSSAKVSPNPAALKPAGRGPGRSKNLCQGGLRNYRGMKDICAIGASASKAKTTFALIGDSHAAQWRPSLNWVGKELDLRIISLTASSCDYIYGNGFKRSEGQKWRDCQRFRRDVPKFLAKSPEISGVFFSSVSQASKSNIAGYQAGWERLPDTIKRVAVIRDNPRTTDSTPACVIKAFKQGRSPALGCSSPRSKALAADSQLTAAREMDSPNYVGLDMSDFFCDQKRCYPVVGEVLVYQDGNHQTPQFNRTLAPYLLEKIRAAWPDL